MTLRSLRGFVTQLKNVHAMLGQFDSYSQPSAGRLETYERPSIGLLAKLPSEGSDALPVSMRAVKETDKTDETELRNVTNEEFLGAVFRDLAGEARPVVCGFPGHPSRATAGNWFGRPWFAGETERSAQPLNRYFSLSSFAPDAEGKYRRLKKTFAALHAIALDDIGAKAAGLDRLTLPPSWLLETSAGNFQAGYIFAAPVTDSALAERLMKAIIAAGLSDRGADGPVVRLMRLPVGITAKHSLPFECRLKEWDPDRRYTPEQIADGLQIDMAVGSRNVTRCAFNRRKARMMTTKCSRHAHWKTPF